jgi:hypothetical protein
MTKQVTFIFPHVPKCGGTTLLYKIQNSSLSSYIDYDAYIGANMHRRNKEVEKIDYSKFDIVYGHFPIERYRGKNYQYIALVRDPLRRSISQYLHTKRRYDEGMLPINHFGKEISNGKMSFIDYLTQRPIVRYTYKYFLGYLKSTEFALIGQVERYTEFTNALSDLIGVHFVNDQKERVSNEEILLSDRERLAALNLLQDEYNWYMDFIKQSV